LLVEPGASSQSPISGWDIESIYRCAPQEKPRAPADEVYGRDSAACGAEMRIIFVITEPEVVDTILRHIARAGSRDPFDERAPPAA
jgi:hypothetical protein